MKLPFPLNWAQAAAVAAAGAAQVAQIRSTNSDGSGGGVPAAGGAAGGSAAPEAAAPSRSLHISGVDRAHFYSGQLVENMIREINEAVKNGVTLISTRNLPI